MLALFRRFPGLASKLDYVSLGRFPTAVHLLPNVCRETGHRHLYIKRDDQSGIDYGGNKVRKLEFLLGRAKASRTRCVLTGGFAGSNHALATAVYAHRLGIDCVSMLLPQPNALYVRRNLLHAHACKAELHQFPTMKRLMWGILRQYAGRVLGSGRVPMIIPPGGSSALGTVGYVNAALELQEQIAAGMLPVPNRIYVAWGTGGTVVGLLVGLKCAGIESTVVGVRVTDSQYANPRKLDALVCKTSKLLRSAEPSFPEVRLADCRFEARHEAFGGGYARFTQPGLAAVELLHRAESIDLDGTYTGKASSLLLADLQRSERSGEVVLFWNTYNSEPPKAPLATADYRKLPKEFHHYFETPTQDVA